MGWQHLGSFGFLDLRQRGGVRSPVVRGAGQIHCEDVRNSGRHHEPRGVQSLADLGTDVRPCRVRLSDQRDRRRCLALRGQGGPHTPSSAVSISCAEDGGSTELGLIDEYELVVHPRIVGKGPTLFAGLSKRVDLKLVGRLEYGSGAVAMRCEPRR
jgi:hypothetical protein